MADLKMTNQGLIYQPDGGGAPVTIIDFCDYYANLGAIPLHGLDERSMRIPFMLRDAAEDFTQIEQILNQPLDRFSIFLVIGILLKHSLGHYKPYRILEIGCQPGGLSYFLTKTAASIHKESKVFCLSEILYDETFMGILTTLGDAVANLSLLTTSKDSGMLREDYFDFVVINGSEFMENPSAVIENALRTVRIGGRLLCLTQGQYLLESCFAVYLDGYEEYPSEGFGKVLVKVIEQKDKDSLELTLSNHPDERSRARWQCLYEEVRQVLVKVRNSTPQQLEETVRNLSAMEDIAIELFAQIEDINLKNKINRVKETLIDYIGTEDEGYKEECAGCFRMDSIPGVL